MNINEVEAIIEAVLFAAGDRVSLEKLSEILEIDKKTTKRLMDNTIESFENSSRGIMIREINQGYQLCTKLDYYEYIKRLIEPRQKQGISQAAFETLSIIAYNRPITKAKIEQIRGVNSDSAVSKLVEKNLVKEAGRMDTPGKPILYETTEEFLRSFGFSSLEDLPVLEMVEAVTGDEEKETESTPEEKVAE